MAFYIEVLNGPQSGSRFKLSLGVKIGRTQGDIILPDSKVSSLHAEVQLDGKKRMVIRDLGSTNALDFSGRKVRKIALIHGLEFGIGRTQFRIWEEADAPKLDPKLDEKPKAKKTKTPKPTEPSENKPPPVSKQINPEEVPLAPALSANEVPIIEMPVEAPEAPSPAINPYQWRIEVKALLEKAQIDRSICQITPMNPIVRLNFRSGIQTEQSQDITYGPQLFGRDSLSNELFDAAATDETFTIQQGLMGPQCLISENSPAQINGKSEKARVLKTGDVITVGETMIEVELLTEGNL